MGRYDYIGVTNCHGAVDNISKLLDAMEAELKEVDKYIDDLDFITPIDDIVLTVDLDYGMQEKIYWVEDEEIDGHEHYSGYVYLQIVRPGKMQEVALGISLPKEITVGVFGGQTLAKSD